MWNNHEKVKESLQKYGYLLKSAPEEIKNNKEYIEIAIQSSFSSIQYISDILKNDKEYILSLVEKYPLVYRHLESTMRDDEMIATLAIEQIGDNLRYGNFKIKNNRSVVIKAIQQNRNSIWFADFELQTDLEIALLALKKGVDYSLFDEVLMNNKEFIRQAIQIDYQAYSKASLAIKSDPEIILQLLDRKTEDPLISWIPVGKRDNGDIAKASMLNNPKSILYIHSNELKNDKGFILFALDFNNETYHWASNEMKLDTDVILKSLKNGLKVELNNKIKNNKGLAIEALQASLSVFEDLYPRYIKKEDVIDIITDKIQNSDFNTITYILQKIELPNSVLNSLSTNHSKDVRKLIIENINFIPTEENIKIGLKDDREIADIYKYRLEEWRVKEELEALKKVVQKYNSKII